MKHSILLVDDDTDFLFSTTTLLQEEFEILQATNLSQARSLIKENYISLVLLDVNLENESGLDLLAEIKKDTPETEVIMLTAVTDTSIAIKAIKQGAYDYLTKPYDPDHLPITCQRAIDFGSLRKHNQAYKVEISKERGFEIIGESPAMKKVFVMIDKVKDKNITVLITGETGTGKELVAKALHYRSNRKEAPFIVVNCGAIPAELLESDLFGHERGAFTSAEEAKIGKFEAAHGGTIFLDEINSLDLKLQAKILRIIQDKIVTRVGSNKSIKVDTRIIAATNQDLTNLVEGGSFRKDLYHRLNVIEIQLPPVTERGQKDIALMINNFFQKFKAKYNSTIEGISHEALELLQKYEWTGNVREIQNTIERLIILADGKEIQPYQLPTEILCNTKFDSNKKDLSLKERLDIFEQKILLMALDTNNYNTTLAAKALQIHRTTLLSKVNQLGLDLEALRESRREIANN